jgi:hypothetical protein
MRARHIAYCIVAGALLLCGVGSQRVSAAPSMSLPDCVGKPQVRPAEVVFACGDGNFSARSLRWTGWGESFAAGIGLGEVNDCTPNCAAGKFHSARIVLIASGRQTCPDGRPAYRTVTYAWVGRSPFPANASGSADPTQTFPCRPMP